MDLRNVFQPGETIKVIDPSVGIILERIAPKAGYWRINKIYPFYLECEALVRERNNNIRFEKRCVSIGDLIMSGFSDRLGSPKFELGGNAYGNRKCYSAES